jgi:hypothetical protein
MNLYLNQIQNTNSILGGDSYDPTDELELEFISGEINDIEDEAEILTTPPKAEGTELRVAQIDIKDRLNEMYDRSRRVKCPMKRKAIQKRIKKLQKHGSLNKTHSVKEQIMWSTFLGLSSVALTALAYQASQTRDVRDVQELLIGTSEDGFQIMDPAMGNAKRPPKIQDLDENGILTARPSIPYLLEKHKSFYLGEAIIVGALYHHFVFGVKK